AAPETQALFEALPRRLEATGARPRAVELPDDFRGIADDQGTIWTYEIARCLADEHGRHRDRIRGVPLRQMLDAGAAMDVAEVDEARARVAACRAGLPDAFHGLDALLVPAAPGEAPALAATGDPILNRVWSALGGPAVAVPAGWGPSGLPLAVQVVGRPGDDARVLAAAAWVASALRPA
ncbi:MAG: amidase, partial [Actinobacteria bacterium]|nr:amidase [Actinomycetota bacterium]